MIADERPTLLIVDDEPDVLHSLHALFRLKYHVLSATRGEDALNLLRDHDVMVVLSDQRMPTMSGVELLAQTARIRPDATRLLFTGHADISAVIDAINQGRIFRYIAKPWATEDLESTIAQAVERHHLIIERRQLVDELERKNAELEDALKLKERFLEVASHELNTPVAVILGIAELWKMTEGPGAGPTQRGWIDRLQAAGHRLASTVERMWSLWSAGSFETIVPVATDLAPLIRRMIADLEPFLNERRQNVHAVIDEGLGRAEIDPPKIADVLTNLLLNAIKFTPDGGTIRLDASSEGPDAVRIRVTDAGIGVPPEDRPHLFKPFFTGHDTRHHSSGSYEFCKRGIGLGLSLVKTFVELHGGRVNYECGSTSGSSFEFILPRRSPARRHADGPEFA